MSLGVGKGLDRWIDIVSDMKIGNQEEEEEYEYEEE